MKFYLAPMEGTTGYIYRNAVHRWFGDGIDKYFTPFVVPHPKKALSPREVADILPENNRDIPLVPQILTNSSGDFFRFEKMVMDLGYDEININIGCPSGTVTAKGRGAGFLEKTEQLDAFLYEVYASAVCKVSVKTRIGMYETGEWPKLLEIYDKYPIHELIVHPRTGKEMYTGTVHMDAWQYTVDHSGLPLCYNGDICRPDLKPLTELSVDEADTLCIPHEEECDTSANGDVVCREQRIASEKLQAVMIGRGMIADPSLIRQIVGGAPAAYDELKGFLTQLREDYLILYGSERNTLHRLKEIWAFMGRNYPECGRELKAVMKAESIDTYRAAEGCLLRKAYMTQQYA